VFIDHVIPAGVYFEDFIARELGSAKAVMVLWSKAAVKSDWVSREAHEGFKRNVLLPVLLEDGVTIPPAFRRLQARSMVDWNESGESQAFTRLVADVALRLGPPPHLGTNVMPVVAVSFMKRFWTGTLRRVLTALGVRRRKAP